MSHLGAYNDSIKVLPTGIPDSRVEQWYEVVVLVFRSEWKGPKANQQIDATVYLAVILVPDQNTCFVLLPSFNAGI